MTTVDASWNMTDYEETRRSFGWEVEEYFDFGTDVVDRWAARAPDREARRDRRGFVLREDVGRPPNW